MSSLKKDITQILANLYSQAYADGTVGHSRSANILTAHKEIINLIESVIGEERDISDTPKAITSDWIRNNPHEAAKLGYRNGFNDCIKDIKSKLIGGIK